MYSDFALRTVLYTILCIGAIGVSTGKLFAINHGISRYLAKKSYSGNFKTVKTTFISLGVEYVSIAIIALFISLCTINTIYTNAFFDELLPEFFLDSCYRICNRCSWCRMWFWFVVTLCNTLYFSDYCKHSHSVFRQLQIRLQRFWSF